MSYSDGNRLPGQRASKLGHLDVIKSPLVNKLIEQFEDPEPQAITSKAMWELVASSSEPLRLIFAVDGSNQSVRSEAPPFKEVSFLKTALLRLDQQALKSLDQNAPHPMALRDIMAESAMYHATILPLKGLRLPGKNNYDAVRRIIFDSLQDKSLNGEPFNTLKWLAYRKWDTSSSSKSPSFECPNCSQKILGLPYDTSEGVCEHCGGEVFLSDMLGFHLEMAEDAAPESVATAYMLIHETLLLFTGIRYYWERKKFSVLSNTLFLKDGPLTLRSQYSKLVIPIRTFIQYASNEGVTIHIAGQEKSGAFTDHLEIISRLAPEGSAFAPSNEYIRKEIQHQPERAEPYGSRTNYGNKLFVKLDKYHHIVLSIPTGEYKDSRSLRDLVGVDRILATLPEITSHRHECALVPIVLADGVASLSSYPSAAILKVFADI